MIGIKRAKLRDELAMSALIGLLSTKRSGATVAAKTAYEYADAMLEARK